MGSVTNLLRKHKEQISDVLIAMSVIAFWALILVINSCSGTTY